MRQICLGEPELTPPFSHAVRDPGEEPAVLRMGKSLADPLERRRRERHAVLLVDLALAVGVLRGSNAARLVLMSICVVVTIVAFLGSAGRPDEFALTHLPTVGVNILVILALSSHRARDYATHARAVPGVGTQAGLAV